MQAILDLLKTNNVRESIFSLFLDKLSLYLVKQYDAPFG